MGRAFRKYLTQKTIYVCSDCSTHLSSDENLVSTTFRGRTGTAWLFTSVINVSEGPYEDRVMTTGWHTIVDIYCNECSSNIGWKYVMAEDQSQHYKIGKFILEKALLSSVHVGKEGQVVCFPMRSEDSETLD